MISVVIITYNEEAMIERTINAVRVLTEDIVVVDSFSTDKTQEKCKDLGVRFYEKTGKAIRPLKILEMNGRSMTGFFHWMQTKYFRRN